MSLRIITQLNDQFTKKPLNSDNNILTGAEIAEERGRATLVGM